MITLEELLKCKEHNQLSYNSKLVVNVNNRGRVPFINIGPQTNISLTFMRVHGLVAMGYNVDLVAVEKSSPILSPVSEALDEVIPVQKIEDIAPAAEVVVDAPVEEASEGLVEEEQETPAAEAVVDAPVEEAAEAVVEDAPVEEASEGLVEEEQETPAAEAVAEGELEVAAEVVVEEAPVEEFVPFTKDELEAMSEEELKEILVGGGISFTLPKKNVKGYLVDLILTEQSK
jgi:hypothetical protein